jgi:hypothetical protein
MFDPDKCDEDIVAWFRCCVLSDIGCDISWEGVDE